eukprot:gene55607-10914_t
MPAGWVDGLLGLGPAGSAAPPPPQLQVYSPPQFAGQYAAAGAANGPHTGAGI